MKKYKPTSPGRRGMTGISYRDVLTSTEPFKSLTKGVQRSVGRNSKGRITVRHKGGGAKRLYREVSFDYKQENIPARVVSVEYDPNRSSFISLVVYKNGARQYRLTPGGVKVGDEMVMSKSARVKSGNALPLGLLPSGTRVYNIELQPGSGGKLARSAGDSAEIMSHEKGLTLVRLPSKELRHILSAAWATVGATTPEERRFVIYGKAGRSRRKGIRPTVRGSAMNPVDHPYGGGEGKAPQGTRRPKNKWGKGVRGVKTRGKKKYSNMYIVSRRPKVKRKK